MWTVLTPTAAYIRFGNRLAEGITVGCSSLSATVPAEEQISAFCILSSALVFQSADVRAESSLNSIPSPSLNVSRHSMTHIINKTNKLKFHTDLKELIKPFKVEFPTFKWMLTNQDYIVLDYETKGVIDQLEFGVDRIVFEGNALLKIIENREVQFIWGVFCAFENNVPNLEPEQLPFADCNSKIWSDPDEFFLTESKIEIICFDGTSTLIRFRDKNLENKFTSYFDESVILEKENAC